MTDKSSGRITAATTIDTQTPFRFRIVHGADPTRKSEEYKAVTRTLSLGGLIFETPVVERDGLHISFTEASFGRNFLEIFLDLGRKLPSIQVIGQVEWYESRPAIRENVFVVGVTFVEIQPDAVALLRQHLRIATGLTR
jgi:hypothetical protein